MFSSTGGWLKQIPAARAEEMLQQRSAIARFQRHRKIREIELRESTPRPYGPPTDRWSGGSKYTYLEVFRDSDKNVLGKVLVLRHIDSRDQDLFMLALTDCGSGLIRRRVSFAGPV